MMSKNSLMPALLLVLLALPAAASDDLIATCEQCHGPGGHSPGPDAPIIAGITGFVLEDALVMFGDGGRPCPTLTTPDGENVECKEVHGLSEDEIVKVARHFAANDFAPAEQQTKPALVTAGRSLHQEKCERCHSGGGSDLEDEASLLKGQWMNYLRSSMISYQQGHRDGPDAMGRAMKALSAEDIDALTHFYASQPD